MLGPDWLAAGRLSDRLRPTSRSRSPGPCWRPTTSLTSGKGQGTPLIMVYGQATGADACRALNSRPAENFVVAPVLRPNAMQ